MRPLMIGQTPDYVETWFGYEEREAEDERRRLRIEASEPGMKSAIMKTFKVSFVGRKIGVIGDCWPITMEVKAVERTDIMDILHETYDQIYSLKTEEVTVDDPWKLKRVVQ